MTEDLHRRLSQAVGGAGPAPVAAITARGATLARRRKVRAGLGAALAVLVVVASALVVAGRGTRTSVHVAATPPAHRAKTPGAPSTTATSTTTTSPTTTSPTTIGFVPRSVPAVPGDVDGDGKPDKVTISWNRIAVTGPSQSPTYATVTAHLTRLGDQTVIVPVSAWLLSPKSSERPAILGVVDLDHDGYGEILVQTDHGASTVLFTILKLVDGRLTQITLDGQPVGLQVTGSVGHPATIGCAGGQLTQNLLQGNWDRTAFDRYDGERDVYAFRGSQLVLVSKTTHTFATNGQPPTDAEFAALGWQAHCAPLD
jgi:hypothetical protein